MIIEFQRNKRDTKRISLQSSKIYAVQKYSYKMTFSLRIVDENSKMRSDNKMFHITSNPEGIHRSSLKKIPRKISKESRRSQTFEKKNYRLIRPVTRISTNSIVIKGSMIIWTNAVDGFNRKKSSWSFWINYTTRYELIYRCTATISRRPVRRNWRIWNRLSTCSPVSLSSVWR